MTVFVPLNGPNEAGKKPKAPSVRGWEAPGYRGINPKKHTGWFGLRCDGLMVVDCDSDDAMLHWSEIDHLSSQTWVRKTPHGWHFIYKWHDPLDEYEHLTGPHAGVLPGIDLRQGRWSQIVFSALGYSTIAGGPNALCEFDPAWAVDFVLRKADAGNTGATWDEMPDGVGNNTMTALAGTMRKQGMSLVTIVRCLAAINRITMTREPMPKEMVIEIARSVSRYEVDPFIDKIEFIDD